MYLYQFQVLSQSLKCHQVPAVHVQGPRLAAQTVTPYMLYVQGPRLAAQTVTPYVLYVLGPRLAVQTVTPYMFWVRALLPRR